MSDIERVPPHSLEAEMCVLGSLLLDNSTWTEVAHILTPQHFYSPTHQITYAAMVAKFKAGNAVDEVLLRELLMMDPACPPGGNDFKYVVSLIESVPSAANIRHYADIVIEKARLRQLITAANEITNQVYEGDENSQDIALKMAGMARGIGAQNQDDDPVSLRQSITDVHSQLDEYASDPSKLTRYQYGLPGLDAMATIMPGDVVVIGGRPSNGKSALLRHIVDATATRNRWLVFTLEDSRLAVARRMWAARANVNLARMLRPNQMEEADWQAILDTGEATSALKVHIVDASSLHIDAIRAKVENWYEREGQGVDAVVVDYVQLVRAEGKDRNSQVGAISAGLKGLAKSLKVPVFVASQLNRNMEYGQREPRLDDFRESGTLEQDADHALLLHRVSNEEDECEFNEKRRLIKVIYAKQRNGPTFPAWLWMELSTLRFDEATRDDAKQITDAHAAKAKASKVKAREPWTG